MNWPLDKVNSYFTHYVTYKHFKGQYYPKEVAGRVFTHRAPFENTAIDNAEFDKAIKRLGKIERDFFLHWIHGVSENDIAWFEDVDLNSLLEVIEHAKMKVKRYLMGT